MARWSFACASVRLKVPPTTRAPGHWLPHTASRLAPSSYSAALEAGANASQSRAQRRLLLSSGSAFVINAALLMVPELGNGFAGERLE